MVAVDVIGLVASIKVYDTGTVGISFTRRPTFLMSAARLPIVMYGTKTFIIIDIE